MGHESDPHPPGGTVLEALRDQVAELDSLVAGLDELAWHQPSRCADWDLCDVVLHLAQTDELAAASVRGEFDQAFTAFVAELPPTADVEAGAGLAVERDRGVAGYRVLARWRAAAADQLAAFAATPAEARVRWVAGELAARSLATTRLAECWIHTEDVAVGMHRELPPTDRLWNVAWLAWRTLPYAAARAGTTLEGAVAFELDAPSDGTWRFGRHDDPAVTVVRGPAVELCRVAGQRLDAAATSLVADGPDADTVLRVVRTFA